MTCSIPDCHDTAYARGWCIKHYARWKRHGDPLVLGTSGHAPKHGHALKKRWSPEYQAWADMIQRCCNPNNKYYDDYGGRGITICEEWRNSFEAFLSAVGFRPSPQHSLDRRENDKGYYPGNVRWATKLEQSRNTRRLRLLTIDGITHCVSEWAEMSGTPYYTIRHRLKGNPTDHRAAVYGSSPGGAP